MRTRKVGRMPNCSVAEKEFEIVAHAAHHFWTSGNRTDAVVLDELARKMTRALTTAKASFSSRMLSQPLARIDIESPLEASGLRKASPERSVKLCILCHQRPAVVPDRDQMGRPIKRVCRECHAARLRGDLVEIREVEGKRSQAEGKA